jgi:hypothetical protein
LSFSDLKFPLLAMSEPAGDGAACVFEAKVLFAWRRQPLLVPAREPRCAHAAVRFFVGNPLLRGLGHLLLTLDRYVPRAEILPLFRWDFLRRRYLGTMRRPVLRTRFCVARRGRCKS